MRIIIADDHTLFRDGLKMLLAATPGFAVVAETGDAPSLKALVREQKPDLVLLDYNMPGGDSGEVLAYLKQRHPEVRVVILTAERSGTLLRHLAGIGADGILLKEGSAAEMLAAIQAVARGRRVIPDGVRAMIEEASPGLTSREFQVLHLICEGWSNARIAERFALSTRTVDKHRENIARKLGVSNAVQLVNKAKELKLFDG